MIVNDAIRELVQQCCNASDIRTQAIKSGMSLLRTDGFAKANDGQTTLSEVNRVSMNL